MMFDFYRRQIEDFPRTERELGALIEEIANNEDLTNDEYRKLYEIAIDKLRDVKEFHLWFSCSYDKEYTSHSYGVTERLIEKGRPIIHTTQVMCVSTKLFEKGYRIIIHCEDESEFEITLGACERTDREIRMGHCLSRMLVNGAFDGVFKEG